MIKATALVPFLLLIMVFKTCPDEKYCRQCSVSSDNTICLTCNGSVYSIDKAKCVVVDPTVVHCQSYKVDKGSLQCTECSYGFTVVNNKCEKCNVKDCARCDSGLNTCDACFDSRIFDGGACRIENQCALSGCGICIDKGERCLECLPALALNKDGKCIAAPENCSKINDEDITKCSLCNYGYFIKEDGQCQSDDITQMSWFDKFILWAIVISIIILLVWVLYGRMRKDKAKVRRNEMEEEYLSIND